MRPSCKPTPNATRRGTPESPASSDITTIFQWLDLHSRDIDEAAWWRAYLSTDDPGERLRLLTLRLDRRPGQPLLPRHDPAIVRAAIVCAYLRGEWAADDLAPASGQWTWRSICDFAETQGAGWDSFQEPDSARGSFRVCKRLGYLDIPDASGDTDAKILGFLTGLATVERKRVFVSRTATP